MECEDGKAFKAARQKSWLKSEENYKLVQL